MESSKKTGLNIGCNEWRIESTPEMDWTNIDIDQNDKIKPDLVCDATKLPFEDNSFDEIYAGHILEHFGRNENVLEEWVRVLKPGGKITVCVPDIEKSLFCVRNGLMLMSFFDNVVFGAEDRDAQNHHQAFTVDILYAQLAKYLKDVQEVTDCPHWVANVVWQSTFSGIK